MIEECERNLAAFIAVLPNRVEPTKAAVHTVAGTVEAKDAPIVAAAIAANASFLATYDRKHLLAKKAEIGGRFGIMVATPDDILAALGT